MVECEAGVVQFPDWPAEYTLCVKGCLDPAWSEWLGGLTVMHTAEGDTLLHGPIEDAPALQSLLARIFALNLLLLFVRRSDAH